MMVGGWGGVELALCDGQLVTYDSIGSNQSNLNHFPLLWKHSSGQLSKQKGQSF